MKINRFSKKNFTLVEILISVFIATFIIAGVLGALIAADKIWQLDMGLVNLQQRTRWALSGMLSELRQASPSNINITNNGTTIEFFNPSSLNSIIYEFNNTQIIREHPVGIRNTLVGDVYSLNFCCWHASVCDNNCSTAHFINVELETRETVKGATLSFSLEEKAGFRNE